MQRYLEKLRESRYTNIFYSQNSQENLCIVTQYASNTACHQVNPYSTEYVPRLPLSIDYITNMEQYKPYTHTIPTNAVLQLLCIDQKLRDEVEKEVFDQNL